MKILFALMLVAAVGCDERNNFVTLVTVNDSATDELTAMIATLTKEVNEELRCEVIGPAGPSDRRRIIELKSNDKLLKEYAEQSIREKEMKGQKLTEEERSVVPWGAYLDNEFVPYSHEEIIFQSRLESELYEPVLHGVLLHELGHALGLQHEEETIMAEYYSFTYNKRSFQLESFKDLIQKNQLNPCDIPGLPSLVQ